MESVTLSEGIREIGTEAFKRTNLKSLNIPKSVKKLGHDIVYNCFHVAYITIEAPSQLEETFDGSQGVFQPSCNTNVYCEPRLVRLLDHFDGNEGFITTVDVTLVDGDTITPKKLTTAQTLRHLTHLPNRVTPLQVGIPMQTARPDIRMHSCLQTSMTSRSMPVGSSTPMLWSATR